ncbi:urea carboxylase [Trametopsis cervina]|nr:urea carboxylase [Trametopsis cervina]
MSLSLTHHKLLVANRGEIAVRILRTARRLLIPTVAIYTRTDATSPHVTAADMAIPLRADDPDQASNARGYLDIDAIVDICVTHGITLVHPGYGFLAENADFAAALVGKGIGWVGPRPDIIRGMGLKHQARAAAQRAGVPVVPGSGDAVLGDVEEAIRVAGEVGYPVLLKATAGGGGIGIAVCKSSEDIRAKFDATRERAASLFHDNGVFIERYFQAARHIEVQIFGNGQGHVIHMGERECSVQRRYQKVIEESPSPFLATFPDIRGRLCSAAVNLCKSMRYNSAGTVEFIVDDATGEFFFLEMNTRIQVEHTVTEMLHPSLDIVELMLTQTIAEHATLSPGLSPSHLDSIASRFLTPITDKWAIQARVYCENPSANFKPSPGVLQHVAFPTMPLKSENDGDWLRVDTWVQTGTTITPFFDPLIAKVIVHGASRGQAVERMLHVLGASRLCGPPNNTAYLSAICASETFEEGKATTRFLEGFQYTPRAVDVLSGGVETTVQDFPGRKLALGIPRSGPMDPLALRIANLVVGNHEGTEGLEITLPAVGCRLFFHVDAVVCVTGASAKVTVGGEERSMWSKVIVPAKTKLVISAIGAGVGVGFRTYLAIRGGFPDVPTYLGSKSTSMGLGGYQGRALIAGDQLSLGDCAPIASDTPITLPPSLIPSYATDEWTIYCLDGPHSDEEFIVPSGLAQFFDTPWRISAASNRMGIRLEGPKIEWARATGGEGGSHPSNIHDNGYALGAVNINGDTPVILTNEGPDMGGYVCLFTVATPELWKLGQLYPGSTVRFKRTTFDGAQRIAALLQERFQRIVDFTSGTREMPIGRDWLSDIDWADDPQDPKLEVIQSAGRPHVVFRQAGDAAILVEYGEAKLDFHVRARVHAFEQAVRNMNVKGVWALCPCIRSTMVRFDPALVAQSDVLEALVKAEKSLPDSVHELVFEGRKITFPIVLDDPWTKDALNRYMLSIRDEAVYLPSNIDYLARNNGLEGGAEEALKLLVGTDWLVFGVGFYLACPFLVPIDPRCRLVGQKMNPSRTYTARGAIGIAGLVAAIYPIESPGGYQLYGRTLPPWQTWGSGADFTPDKPHLLQPFDQVAFEIVSETQYTKIELQFDAGQYKFKIEPATFSIRAYDAYVESISEEIAIFRERQAEGVAREETRESELLARWEARKREERERFNNVMVDSNSAPQASLHSGFALTASMAAGVWKLPHHVGYIVQSAEDVLVVLEVMKTEINVEAGEENIGRTVSSYGPGIRIGAVVKPGQVLMMFE